MNYPCNPTGQTYSPDHLQALAEVARRYGMVILSDEIYGELDHEAAHVSMASFYPDGTIVTAGLRGCLGFAEASLLGMAQETEKPCLKPSLTVLHMLVPMLCVGTHRRNALRSKTTKFGRRAPWRAFPRRTVGTRKQKPKQPG